MKRSGSTPLEVVCDLAVEGRWVQADLKDGIKFYKEYYGAFIDRYASIADKVTVSPEVILRQAESYARLMTKQWYETKYRGSK